MRLVFDVDRDDLIGDIPTAAAEVAACPDVLAPELLAQVRKLGEQLVCGLPFEVLHPGTKGDLGRDRDKEVDGVFGDMAFEDANLLLAPDLPQQLSDPQCHLAGQYLATILGDPD
jgi:hypothetical protein